MNRLLTLFFLILLPSLVRGQQPQSDVIALYRNVSAAKNDTARMKAFTRLATYYSSSDRDSSNFFLQKAMQLAVKLDLRYDEANLLNGLGVILMQQEKFSRSLEYYLKAINILKDPGIEKTILKIPTGKTARKERLSALSVSYDLIGLLNAYTGNWIDNTKNQMANYREAEKYAMQADDTIQLAYLKFHMGIAFMNENKLDTALQYINNAIATFTTFNDSTGLGRATKYLGDTYSKMGNDPLAAETILRSVPYFIGTHDYVHLALAYLSLNNVYTKLDKNDSALYYVRESLRIYKKRRDPFGEREAYSLLTASFDRLGQTDSAIVYLKLAKSLGDSLSREERKNLLAFQDVVLEEQAKLEKMEKDKIESRSKLRTYLLASGILVFIIIVFLLYRNNKQRRKTNETLQEQKEEVEKALEQLRSTQTQLIQSEKMASLGELTAGIAHEIQNPLNFINNFSEVTKELINEMKEANEKGDVEEGNGIMQDIIQNLDKINHHGKRADAIVKGMLQHSRSSSGTKEPSDINTLCEEFLRLSYHGLRAKDKSFNATMKTELDPTIGLVNIISQDMGRVILNLVTNAFYSVNEKNKLDIKGYLPTVSLETKRINGKVEIRVSDNGMGIPLTLVNKIFQPFFTTKPTGQGTGLGLSLSYDIITKGHNGDIKVETKEGEGSTFIIVLPV